ncbi:hypothetical protein CK203_027718 [Vitis vinifera]|nr:hypothetical protein CK203_027710 [Vitis vinifera]RVW96072.1 hypothetical protein CK203_027718 [Vitis vinifera]
MLLLVKDAIEPGSSEANGCVTSNLVIVHSTHVVPLSTISIPSIDHVDDDGVQMMRSKDTESKPIILDERSHGGY